MSLREAYIVDAVRTPIGRLRGALSGVRPDDLAAGALRALVERTGLDPAAVDDVVFGCANQAGEATFTWDGHNDSGERCPAGSYSITVHATDAAGNVSTPSIVTSVTYDTTPPSVPAAPTAASRARSRSSS